jgi:energy-coupling factor transport system ATP-binding protein
LKPKAGRVLIDGKDTRQLSVASIANTLGYVFQSPSHMLFAPTVREELTFGPKNLGHDPQVIKEEVQKAVEIVHLTGREEDPPWPYLSANRNESALRGTGDALPYPGDGRADCRAGL